MTQAWSPTALNFVQHQLCQVANFWKLGRKAEFHLQAGEGGLAELKLTFQLPSPCESIPPPSYAPPSAPSSPQSAVIRSCGLKKANLSRMRRRVKRAAERAAAENAAATASAAVNAAAAVKASETTAVEGAVETDAGEIPAAESADSEIAAENVQATVNESGGLEGASTSRIPAPSSRSVGEELALPLCHYCCHKGSDMDPVHYEHMCICDDRDCSCGCYCTEAQLEHRKLHFPGVWSERYHERRAVMLLDRPKAMAVAEARIVKWNGNRPCWQPSCLLEN